MKDTVWKTQKDSQGQKCILVGLACAKSWIPSPEAQVKQTKSTISLGARGSDWLKRVLERAGMELQVLTQAFPSSNWTSSNLWAPDLGGGLWVWEGVVVTKTPCSLSLSISCLLHSASDAFNFKQFTVWNSVPELVRLGYCYRTPETPWFINKGLFSPQFWRVEVKVGYAVHLVRPSCCMLIHQESRTAREMKVGVTFLCNISLYLCWEIWTFMQLFQKTGK